MNSIRNIPLHVLLLAGMIVSAETPTSEKSTKPEAKATSPANPEAKLQAYSGVNVTSMYTRFREQELKTEIPEGIGVIVGFVDPEGPAANKLQEKDVLTRLDDQMLVNSEQFRALISTRKPGDTVKLVRVRGDEIDTVDVTLGGRPVATPRAQARTATGNGANPPNPGSITLGSGVRILVNGQEIDPGQMIAGGSVRLDPNATGGGRVVIVGPNSANIPDEVRQALEDMRKRGLPVPPDVGGGMVDDPSAASPGVGTTQTRIVRSFSFGAGPSGATSTSSSMFSDDEGSVSVRSENGKKFATVKDANGQVLFDGEITTPEQLKAQTDSIKSRIALADGKSVVIPPAPGSTQDPAVGAPATSPKPAPKKKPKRDPLEGA
jgi:hypothetical protein